MRLVVLLALGCALLPACFRVDIVNGMLQCADVEPRCPDGYYCATDNTCWQTGTGPPIHDLAVD